MNIQKLMKQAKKMQDTIAAVEVDGQAGGGAVVVKMNAPSAIVAVAVVLIRIAVLAAATSVPTLASPV